MAKQIRIIDGDTIEAVVCVGFDTMMLKRLRLIGIDAPEINSKNPHEKKLGERAKLWLETKLDTTGGEAIVLVDFSAKDKYGRFLTTLNLPEHDLCLNEMMVNEKIAWKYGMEKNLVALMPIDMENDI